MKEESRSRSSAAASSSPAEGAEKAVPSLPWVVAGLVVACLTYSVMLGDGHTIFVFAGKEQLFEDLSAWFFLLACLLALAAWVRSRRQVKAVPPLRRLAYVLLALFFFVAFGEELSWGQHFFGFSTPAAIESLNQQEELNLHNLTFIDSNDASGKKRSLAGKLLNSNRLFDYFMIGLFAVAPLGYRFWPWFRRVYGGLGGPLVALPLAVALIFNVLLTLATELWLAAGNVFRHMAISEIRELNYAVLCFMGMAWLLAVEQHREKTDTASIVRAE